MKDYTIQGWTMDKERLKNGHMFTNENLEQQAQAFFQESFIDNADPKWVIGTISDLGAT